MRADPRHHPIRLCSQLPVDDLFNLVETHPEYYLGGDGVHLVARGVTVQAQQVAAEILKSLDKKHN